MGKVVFQCTSLEDCQRQPGAIDEKSVYCGQRGNIEGSREDQKETETVIAQCAKYTENYNLIMSL